MEVKFTIITPNYNQGKFIEDCIQSVINQGYGNIEFIIVDAVSTDNSIEIINKYKKNITHIIVEKDKGTYDAINKALKIATGDYVCVLNSDDIFLDNCLNIVNKYIQENQNPDWLTGGVHVLSEKSNIKGKVIPKMPDKILGLTFLNNCWIYHPCTFVKKSVMEKIGYFSPVDALDYEYWLRMEFAGFRPIIINEYLAGLRFHSNCKSFDYIKITEEIKRIAQNFAKEKQLEGKELDNRLKEQDIVILKYKVFNDVLESKKIKALYKLLKFIVQYPKELLKRWLWGALKRVFIGINESEFSPVYYIKD
jgi:glycosyltransferase involved in cell wall biosynthesis